METNRYDAYREDRAGRANVADSPERVAYYQELARLETGALWTVANKIEPWAPRSASVPVVWRYQDLRGHVLRSAELVSPEEAGRRVIYLNNPGRRDVAAAVGWLYSGLQVMKPGELASAHAHSHSALRFIMEGSGAYTIVDGHKMTLGANDFVLTPNGTWHEHGVSEDGTTCIWQDGLTSRWSTRWKPASMPCIRPEPGRHASSRRHHRHLGRRGAASAGPGWTKPYSPLFKYEWEPTYEALRHYARVTAGSPYDGVLLEYVNPMTGGPVMPTIGASMQLLRPGEHTKAHRHTGSFIYQVAKGSGYSIIEGRRYDWTERDIFCVPSWAMHEHVNLSSNDDACLFCFNDLPVMRALSLYREEALKDNDGHQTLI